MLLPCWPPGILTENTTYWGSVAVHHSILRTEQKRFINKSVLKRSSFSLQKLAAVAPALTEAKALARAEVQKARVRAKKVKTEAKQANVEAKATVAIEKQIAKARGQQIQVMPAVQQDSEPEFDLDMMTQPKPRSRKRRASAAVTRSPASEHSNLKTSSFYHTGKPVATVSRRNTSMYCSNTSFCGKSIFANPCKYCGMYEVCDSELCQLCLSRHENMSHVLSSRKR